MFEAYIKDYNETVFEIDKEAAIAVVENASGMKLAQQIQSVPMPCHQIRHLFWFSVFHSPKNDFCLGGALDSAGLKKGRGEHFYLSLA